MVQKEGERGSDPEEGEGVLSISEGASVDIGVAELSAFGFAKD